MIGSSNSNSINGGSSSGGGSSIVYDIVGDSNSSDGELPIPNWGH